MAEVKTAIYEEFAEFITSEPTLEQIVQFQVSEPTQARISELLTANHNRRLTDSEEAELNEYMRLEHIVRRAKIRALQKLAQRKGQP